MLRHRPNAHAANYCQSELKLRLKQVETSRIANRSAHRVSFTLAFNDLDAVERLSSKCNETRKRSDR